MARYLWLCGLLLVGTFGGPAQRGTAAYLTSSAQSTGNVFSAGTLHISDNLAVGTTLSMDNLVAGDNFDAELDVVNSGSLPLTYSLSTTFTGDSTLANALQVTVRSKSANPCATRDGTVLYSGALAAAAVGNPAHGVQAGDRTLAGAASEALCFTIVLPASAGSDLLATNVAPTFELSAEQS